MRLSSFSGGNPNHFHRRYVGRPFAELSFFAEICRGERPAVRRPASRWGDVGLVLQIFCTPPARDEHSRAITSRKTSAKQDEHNKQSEHVTNAALRPNKTMVTRSSRNWQLLVRIWIFNGGAVSDRNLSNLLIGVGRARSHILTRKSRKVQPSDLRCSQPTARRWLERIRVQTATNNVDTATDIRKAACPKITFL